MKREIISDKQGILLIMLFLSGTAILRVFGVEAKKGFWLSIILAIFMALLMALIYSRLNQIFPNKNLLEIIEICFGTYVGKFVIIIITYYFIEEGTFVLINYTQYVSSTTLPETPQIIITICIIILCCWALKKGIEVMGRWVEYMIIPFVSLFLITFFFTIPNMNINNLRPILDVDIKSVLKGAFITFAFPFGEILAFTVVFSSFRTKKSSYKIYFTGLIFGAIAIFIVSSSNIMVLGINRTLRSFYPSHVTASRITIRNVTQSVEVIVATLYTLGAFVKISVYFFATSKGIAKVLRYNDYRFIVIPTGLLIINLSYFFFDGTIEFWDYNNKVWPYYAVVIQMIFPILIFILAEIKKKQLL